MNLEAIKKALEAKGYQVVKVDGNTLVAVRGDEFHRVKVEGGLVKVQTNRPTMDLMEALFP